MAHFFTRNAINRLFLTAVLISISITYALPLPAIQLDIGMNEITFMVRLEKLVEKLLSSQEKDNDKIISYIVDIKREIESSFNLKFDLDQYFNKIQKEIGKGGVKADKRQFDAIKKMIIAKDKKAKSHARYVADTMYLEGYQMNACDESALIDSLEAKHRQKDTDEEKEPVVLPSLLVYGVGVSLCGLMLMFLPIPACKEWGGRMVVAGVTACANSICSKTDEDKRKDTKYWDEND